MIYSASLTHINILHFLAPAMTSCHALPNDILPLDSMDLTPELKRARGLSVLEDRLQSFKKLNDVMKALQKNENSSSDVRVGTMSLYPNVVGSNETTITSTDLFITSTTVRDVDINNEKSLTGSTSLEFNLNVDNELEEKVVIGGFAYAIKKYSQQNCLFAAALSCALESVNGCQQLQIIVCAKGAGDAVDTDTKDKRKDCKNHFKQKSMVVQSLSEPNLNLTDVKKYGVGGLNRGGIHTLDLKIVLQVRLGLGEKEKENPDPFLCPTLNCSLFHLNKENGDVKLLQEVELAAVDKCAAADQKLHVARDLPTLGAGHKFNAVAAVTDSKEVATKVVMDIIHGVSGSSVCDPNYVDDTNRLVCRLDELISVGFTVHDEKYRDNSALNSGGICDISSNSKSLRNILRLEFLQNVESLPGNGNGDENKGGDGRKNCGRKETLRNEAVPGLLEVSVSNDAAESAATSFNSCSTSSITNVPRKKCISSSSGGVLHMQMKMFVLVLFFCLMHGSFAFEGPARHYDGGDDGGGDDRIIATKDQMNEISFDLDYSSADSLASSRTADLVSKCSVSNDATATLDCIDAVAAKRAILNATLLADTLHAFSTSYSDAFNLDSNGETCRSIDSADVFDREDEIDDGSNGYGQAARRFDDDDDDDEKLTDCPLGRMSSSLTDLNSIDVKKDGAVGLNVDDITFTSTLASVEFNVKLEQGT